MTKRLDQVSQSVQSLEELQKLDKDELIAVVLKLQNQALIDPMTGLSNRKHFDQVLEEEFSLLPGKGVRRASHNSSVGLLVFDLDGFKGINDTFGHDVGDLVLIAVGEALSQSLRKTDLKARWGGDEFGAILTDVEPETLQAMARKVLKAISKIKLAEHPEIKVKASIGGMVQFDQNKPAKALFKRADQALYEAKQNGGNRVIIDH